MDVVMNVGGFGQTEEQLVVQSETRVYAGLAFMLLGTITQVALCLKKKQYERWKAFWIRGLFAIEMSGVASGGI